MFSVIIPLYNKAAYICRAIDSVLAQSFKKYEIIVVNDGSTDGSDQLVEKEYSNQIRLIHQPNQGVSGARNKGIANAKFSYVSFLDADDFWHPDYLMAVKNAISKEPTAGIIGTCHNKIGANHILTDAPAPVKKSKVAPPAIYYNAEEYFKRPVYSTLVWTSATTIKKEFFDTHPSFDPQIRFGEDLDVWFRAILFYGSFLYIPCSLAYYSKEDGSAATRKTHLLEHTLIPKIIKKDYFQADQLINQKVIEEFRRFRIKWIYLRLYPNYKIKENHLQIKSLLSKLPRKYFFLGILYQIPFEILHKLFSNRYTQKILVKYIEFCLTYIYK